MTAPTHSNEGLSRVIRFVDRELEELNVRRDSRVMTDVSGEGGNGPRTYRFESAEVVRSSPMSGQTDSAANLQLEIRLEVRGQPWLTLIEAADLGDAIERAFLVRWDDHNELSNSRISRDGDAFLLAQGWSFQYERVYNEEVQVQS